jgi:hypothetical protein
MSWFSNLIGGGKKDDTAAQTAALIKEMRDREDTRIAKVREGQAGIDTAFAQFDQPYFDKFKQTYTDYYNPQIADQYARAKDKMVATLAGRGTLESTVGAGKISDLAKTRAESETQVANQGVDAASQMRKQIDDTKGNLYTLNSSAADPAAVSARAVGAASAVTGPSLSPLQNVFASALNTFNSFNKADSMSMSPKMPWNTMGGTSSAPLSGRGSASYGR